MKEKKQKPEKKEVVHRVANPLRTDFEIEFDNPVLNNSKEPHLKDSELVTDFALKSQSWYIKSKDLDYINKQFGFFFLHQKYLLEERYNWVKKGKMNDTLDPLLELKEYFKRVLAFINNEIKMANIHFDSLDSVTKQLIIDTLSDAKKYLSELYSILEIQNDELDLEEINLENEMSKKEYKIL